MFGYLQRWKGDIPAQVAPVNEVLDLLVLLADGVHKVAVPGHLLVDHPGDELADISIVDIVRRDISYEVQETVQRPANVVVIAALMDAADQVVLDGFGEFGHEEIIAWRL